MKAKINDLLIKAIDLLYKDNDFSIEIVKTKSEMHGDWSSNIAMIVAKKKGENPKELAQKINKISGRNLKIIYQENMPSSAKFRVLNNNLSNNKLKIKKTNLDKGLKQTISWYKKNI